MKIFADGADLDTMVMQQTLVDGFTTNPSLLRKAGVSNYLDFARRAVAAISKPISFEVIADTIPEMELEARRLNQLGSQVYVKIPITTTRGQNCLPAAMRLSLSGVKVNITAVMSHPQIQGAIETIGGLAPAIVSVFAGRIADTGRDPTSYITTAVVNRSRFSNVEVLWASPREVLNVYQARKLGCDIITLTPDLLKKLALEDKNLEEYSLETVLMFATDAAAAGLSL